MTTIMPPATVTTKEVAKTNNPDGSQTVVTKTTTHNEDGSQTVKEETQTIPAAFDDGQPLKPPETAAAAPTTASATATAVPMGSQQQQTAAQAAAASASSGGGCCGGACCDGVRGMVLNIVILDSIAILCWILFFLVIPLFISLILIIISSVIALIIPCRKADELQGRVKNTATGVAIIHGTCLLFLVLQIALMAGKVYYTCVRKTFACCVVEISRQATTPSFFKLSSDYSK